MKPKGIFSTAALKYIAMITMTIDHIGYLILYNLSGESLSYDISRYIGRTAFPIFAFLIAQGFVKTSNKMKYFTRLLIFAIISEPFFNYSFSGGKWFYPEYQNVIITLLLGYISVAAVNKSNETNKWYIMLISPLCMFLAEILKSDYGAQGVILVTIMYLAINNVKYVKECSVLSTIAVFNQISFIKDVRLPYWVPAAIPLYLYNGEKGEYPKYLFYVYYPLHLMVLHVVYTIIT